MLVPVTIQVKNRDITFVNKDGVQRGTVNIFGRVTTLTGHIAQTFEDTVQVDVPAELLPKVGGEFPRSTGRRFRCGRAAIAWTSCERRERRPGGNLEQGCAGAGLRGRQAGRFFADRGGPDGAGCGQERGHGNFVIGTTKCGRGCRRRTASRSCSSAIRKLNFWMQVYNLGVDDKTHKPSATVEYDVVNAATNKAVIHTVESTDQMGNIGDQVTLQKTLSAANLDPGVYRIQIKVNDNISKQTVDPSATFAVE